MPHLRDSELGGRRRGPGLAYPGCPVHLSLADSHQWLWLWLFLLHMGPAMRLLMPLLVLLVGPRLLPRPQAREGPVTRAPRGPSLGLLLALGSLLSCMCRMPPKQASGICKVAMSRDGGDL